MYAFSPVDIGRVSSSTKLSQQLPRLWAVYSNKCALVKIEETDTKTWWNVYLWWSCSDLASRMIERDAGDIMLVYLTYHFCGRFLRVLCTYKILEEEREDNRTIDNNETKILFVVRKTIII